MPEFWSPSPFLGGGDRGGGQPAPVHAGCLGAIPSYFTVTGAVDRFFSARLVLKHCFDQDTLTEELRDRYRQHTVDIIMAGILAR